MSQAERALQSALREVRELYEDKPELVQACERIVEELAGQTQEIFTAYGLVREARERFNSSDRIEEEILADQEFTSE